jgi:hypothetical protein
MLSNSIIAFTQCRQTLCILNSHRTRHHVNTCYLTELVTMQPASKKRRAPSGGAQGVIILEQLLNIKKSLDAEPEVSIEEDPNAMI